MGEPALQLVEHPEPITPNHYIVTYIKRAMGHHQLDAPDIEQLNGYGERREVREALESIYLAHKKGNKTAAQDAWVTQIARTIPDIAEVVNRKRRLYHSDELKDLPPLQWIIQGEIPENSFVVLYGQPESGKSFKAVDYACRIAARQIKTQSRSVIYIAAEGQSGYRKRYEAWRQFNKSIHGTMPLYFYFDAVNMLNEESVTEFILEVQHLKPQMIVIDTIALCMLGGDENSARDMGEFINSVKQLQRDLGATVLALHHTTKTGTTERGSGALRGAADLMIEMKSSEGVISITNTKMKDAKRIGATNVKMKVITLDDGVTSCVLVPAEMVQESRFELSNNQARLIEQLSTYAFNDGARTSDLQRASEVSGGSFYAAINSLANRGFVKKAGKYDPWMLTNDGMKLVQRLKNRGE